MYTSRGSSIRFLATAAILAAAGASGSSAFAAQPDLPGSRVAAPPARATMIAERETASRITLEGRFDAARRRWARVAEMQRALGDLPIEPMRMRAEIEHALGYDESAAAVLERLGEEAVAAGNAEVAARAFLDAASLYQQARSATRARRCLDRVERLLESGAIDPALRSNLEARIVRS